MTADELIEALELPVASRVDRRVPKTMLAERGSPTAADRRHITRGIEELRWVAALKPTTIGVAAHRSAAREYLEIAVLRLRLRDGAPLARLVELVHRATPYPAVIVVDAGSVICVSLAHKRHSLSEGGKIVVDGAPYTVELPATGEASAATLAAFRAALSPGAQSRESLYALYSGWCDAAVALAAAVRTGQFVALSDPSARTARWEALAECERLDAEGARLRASAVKERQLPRQVEINLALQQVESARRAALARIRGTEE